MQKQRVKFLQGPSEAEMVTFVLLGHSLESKIIIKNNKQPYTHKVNTHANLALTIVRLHKLNTDINNQMRHCRSLDIRSVKQD